VNASQREGFRRRLQQRQGELRELLERAPQDTSAVAPDNAIGRLTRMEAMQAGYVTEALRREHQKELARIERALQAIDDESFGTCRRCGDELPLGRLEAKPDALLCVPCTEARERSR
jgi:DnaK suppressor protein